MRSEEKNGGALKSARLELSGVERTFPETGPVIDTLDLTVEPGEFVALLGPSGCGKSTLLRLVAGLDRAQAGKVTVENFGRPYFRGFVFQDAHLLPWRTVLDNASLPLELTGVSRSKAREKAMQVLARVGLGDAISRYPNQLSGGMKMRVSLARALVTEPSLLLLDEPFAALDENTRFRLQEDLRTLWETSRMTVVFVTHSVSEAVFLADRLVVLSARPARILLDRKSTLPYKRGTALRTDPVYWREIETVTASFRKGEGRS